MIFLAYNPEYRGRLLSTHFFSPTEKYSATLVTRISGDQVKKILLVLLVYLVEEFHQEIRIDSKSLFQRSVKQIPAAKVTALKI